MKILFYGLNFAPELVGCAKYNSELVNWLAEQGHEVRVICAPPYYPQWQRQKPFSAVKYYKTAVQAAATKPCRIYRCPIYVPTTPTGTRRLLHLASFALSSIGALAAQRSWRPDLVFTVAPTLFCAPAAILFARLTGAIPWLHLQDFEVDAAFEMGLLQHPRLAQLARFLERSILTRFAVVSTISQKMSQLLRQKEVSAANIFLLPNWVDLETIYPLARPSSLRRQLNIANDSKVCLFSGNLGVKQGLSMITTAARQLAGYNDLHFVICGNGPQRRQLEEESRGLTNLSFIDLQPPEQLNELLNLADIHLLPQLGEAADLVMPSKLTGMLASGRPVVAAAAPHTEIAHALKDCGLISPPGNVTLFGANIIELLQNHSKRATMGEKARHYAAGHCSKNAVLTACNHKINRLVAGHRA